MAVVGIPPMHYLAKWRMQIASGLLSSGSVNIATIATEIGYGSEAAFSRAFKKLIGVPPSAWRRRLAQTGMAGERPSDSLVGGRFPTPEQEKSPPARR